MMTPGRLRALVREILANSAPYGQTEKMMITATNERVPGKVDLTEFRAAREWNHGKEYLRSKRNEDTDQVEFFATAKGLAKRDEDQA